MKRFLYTTFIILIIVIICPRFVSAAGVSLNAPTTVTNAETFDVFILLDTDEESINSVNLILDFDEDLLSFSGYKSDGAMINLWVHAPKERDGEIYMEGVIPGGISGLYDPKKKDLGDIPLVHLLFTSKKSGVARFNFSVSEILKHDGLGSKLTHEVKGDSVVINEIINKENIIPPENIDSVKPESFEITLIDSSIISRTPPLIIFNTVDNESGIKEYQLNIPGKDWTSIESPHELQKGLFTYTATVRAYDFYGNFTDASIVVPGFLPKHTIFILMAVLILLGIIYYVMIKYKR